VLDNRSYALDGVYLPGDRVRSVLFDVEFAVSELFGLQNDRARLPKPGAHGRSDRLAAAE
jgi:hypothetical protein